MALRQTILNFSSQISEHWKYKLPFYYYKGKPFCYLWQDKNAQPYIGIVKGKLIDHPLLFLGKRKKMKVFMIDPNDDLPIKEMYAVFEEAVTYYP
jgi:hypothetical protein